MKTIRTYNRQVRALWTPTLFEVLLIGGLICAPIDARASPATPIVLALKGHRFTPNQIAAPAGQRFTIQVRNLDDAPEEFESYDFKVEKIIVPHGSITVSVGPLKPGVYKFFGEYNATTAQGVLRVVSPAGRP